MVSKSSLIAVIALALVFPSPGMADQEKSDKKKSKWARAEEDEDGFGDHDYAIDKRTGKKLGLAKDAIAAEDYDAAEAALDRIRMRNLNPLERAQVFRFRAYVANARGDIPTTRDFLEKAIAEEVLPRSDVAALRYQIAQLCFQEENWAEGARHLEIWLTVELNPSASGHYALGLAYYQLGQLDRSLANVTRALEIGPEAREGWLQLQLAIYLTNQRYEEAIPVIEELVGRFPKKNYWLSLSTVHGALGSYEEALTPLQLAYTQGLLTESAELMRLAQLLLFLDLPYRAALVLEKGLAEGTIESEVRAWEMLSGSWINAREYGKAAGPLARAAEIAEDGSLYVRLARVHIQREEWQAATEALRRGINKGIEEPGEALLLMGIALHSQKDPRRAREWFARARKYDSAREEADSWLQFIARELAAS